MQNNNADINAMISQMTIEEKAALCTGATNWKTVAVDRLDLPSIFVADGPHGLRKVENEGLGAKSLPATCFPTASSTASSWDQDLLYQIGQAIADEALALGVDIVLGPGTNMKRTPLCGRNFEYFSEDPFLAGHLAASYIQGVQDKGIGTSLKHYAANNQEYQRFSIDAVIDERTLREIYLPAFETAVKIARPWTVMCAYNKINGTYGSEHYHLLTEILKDEWGFEGLVVSDWGAVHDRVAALKGGLDLEMPGPRPKRVADVVEAVKSGQLDQAVLDESVRRILGIVHKAGETAKGADYDTQAHHALARKIAAEGMVLLKNNGILPLKGADTIAVIGRAAQEAHFQGGGSSHINPTQVDVPFVELDKMAEGAELLYAEGYPKDDSFQPALIDAAVEAAMEGDIALLYLGLPSFKESEGYDRVNLDLTVQQVALIKAVTAVQPRTVVIINNGSAVAMNEWIDGAAAVLEAWMMGQAGGGAIADVLLGKVNPSGKLSESYPLKVADTPAHINFPGENGQVRYGEGLFIGYRYYDAKQMPVLFPFGFGLSYTNFEYSNPKVSASTFKDRDGISVSVDITNTGAVAGKEIVQVYVHDFESKLVRPIKELKGFAKVNLQPGETQTIIIPLDFRAFAFYHPGYGQWITEDGKFEILIGASSADIRFTESVILESTVELPSILDRESTIREWLEDPKGKQAFAPIFQMMQAQMAATFGDPEEGQESVGMDMMGFLMEMPLLSVLGFQQEALPMEPSDMVDSLLNQVHGTME